MPYFRCTFIVLIIFTAFVSQLKAQTMQVGECPLDISNEMSLKWIGKGLTDKLLTAEVIFSQAMVSNVTNFDGSYNYKTTSARLSLLFQPQNVLDLKLTMPFLLRQGPEGKTGPFGDLAADISRSWGKKQRFDAGLTLGFPIGYSSIMKDDDDLNFLSPQLQPGSGIFSATARLGYSLVPEWGIFNIGASYCAGLLAVRTTEYGIDTSSTPGTIKILYNKKNLEFARDGWGARNDAGINRPDYIGVYAAFGLKTETVSHGINVGYYYPAAPYKQDVYSKDHTASAFASKEEAQASLDNGNAINTDSYFVAGQLSDGTWEYLKKSTASQEALPSFLLQYNIEKNDKVFPIFLGAGLKFDYKNRLNLGGFTIGLGFKYPVL
jgi:hypothetical protein